MFFEQESRLTAEGLELAGKALFGERWKSPVATSLGIGSSRIRDVIRGDRRSPPGWTTEVKALLKAQAERCQKALELLEKEEG